MSDDPIEKMQTLLRRTQNRSYTIAAAILASVLIVAVNVWLEVWWLAALGAFALIVNAIAGIMNYRLERQIEREIERAVAIKWKLPI